MALEGGEILLVEDNPTEVELILRALKKHNLDHRVFLVKDGEQALDFVFRRGDCCHRPARPKVILLDLKLPKIDGLEVVRRIKSDPRTRAIPVVVFTSSSEEKDLIESYNLGVNSYVVKAVDFDEFISSVAQLVRYWVLLNQVPQWQGQH